MFFLLPFSLMAQERAWKEIPYFLHGYEKLYKESPNKAALEWFKNARFGLFIHWGPATLYGEDEWVMYNKKIPLKDYEQNCRLFKGENFDADKIVDLALKAHMKYITFVVKHHDGFALWNSKASDYNSYVYPAHRDFVKELSQACQKKGIALFLYYSIGIDWHYPYFLPNTMYRDARPHYDVVPKEYKYENREDFKYYLNYAKTQIMELCTQYGPIAGIWFDTIGGVYQFGEMFNIQDIYDMIHRIQPHALITFKTGVNGNEDFITGERQLGSLGPMFKQIGLPPEIYEAADKSWEMNKRKPAELNTPIQTLGWSYHKKAKQRSAKYVLSLLRYCATVNSNLLLNIGPLPDGSLFKENINALTEVGDSIQHFGFPKVPKDFQANREKAVYKLDEEKENQTAR
jgi:alpha-L-fucosidase